MIHDHFQPPEDPAHDEWVREQQAEAHWEQQVTGAYAEGRRDEREELMSKIKGSALAVAIGLGLFAALARGLGVL